MLALVLVGMISILLGGCTRAPSPTPPTATATATATATPTATPIPSRSELVATSTQLTSGPLQIVLPELAAQAIARDAVLVVPAGRYQITATVLLPVGTQLRLTTGAELIGDLPGMPLLRLAARSRLTGGSLENTSPNPGFDLDLAPSAAQVDISGVTFRGAASNALYIAATGIRDLQITDNRFEQVGYGILLNPPAQDAKSIEILRNTFVNACADSIEINAPTGGTDQRVRNVSVVGNRVSGSCGSGPDAGFGVGMAGVDGFRIADNVILDARNEAIHMEDGTTNGTVLRNRIDGGGHGDRPAIAIYRTTSQIVVTGNSVADFLGGGIAVRWDGLGSARAVTIERNQVRKITGDGIVVSGTGGTGPFIVRDNSLSSISGNGIAVIGPHEQTTVIGNVLRRITGTAIAEELRGTGRTVVEGNSIE